jgi:hypothetical protein
MTPDLYVKGSSETFEPCETAGCFYQRWAGCCWLGVLGMGR